MVVAAGVPSVVGRDREAAAAAIRGVGLAVAERPVPSDSAVGTVLAQDPAAGAQAAPGTVVTIDVAVARTAEVPDIGGRPLAEAGATVTARGFKLNVAERRQDSAAVEGTVLSQAPAAGTQAPLGSTVAVVLAVAPQRRPVPNLFGLSRADADARCREVGFVMNVVGEVATLGVAAGFVAEQDPKAQTVLTVGSGVAVRIASLDTSIDVPDLRGLDQARATDLARAIGLSSQVTGTAPGRTGHIVDQDPQPGQPRPARLDDQPDGRRRRFRPAVGRRRHRGAGDAALAVPRLSVGVENRFGIRHAGDRTRPTAARRHRRQPGRPGRPRRAVRFRPGGGVLDERPPIIIRREPDPPIRPRPCVRDRAGDRHRPGARDRPCVRDRPGDDVGRTGGAGRLGRITESGGSWSRDDAVTRAAYDHRDTLSPEVPDLAYSPAAPRLPIRGSKRVRVARVAPIGRIRARGVGMGTAASGRRNLLVAPVRRVRAMPSRGCRRHPAGVADACSAFLALQRRSLTRAFVAASLWPDTTDAKAGANLRTALWRLHRPELDVIAVNGVQLALRPDVWVDARYVEEAAGHRAPGRRRPVTRHRHGPARRTAPGCWDSWLVFERERLRQECIQLCEQACVAAIRRNDGHGAVLGSDVGGGERPLAGVGERVADQGVHRHQRPRWGVRHYSRLRRPAPQRARAPPVGRDRSAGAGRHPRRTRWAEFPGSSAAAVTVPRRSYGVVTWGDVTSRHLDRVRRPGRPVIAVCYLTADRHPGGDPDEIAVRVELTGDVAGTDHTTRTVCGVDAACALVHDWLTALTTP